MVWFIIGFAITLIGYLIHTFAHYYEHQGKKTIFQRVHHLMDVVIFIGYAAWVFMLISDPSRFDLAPAIALPIGLVIGILGVILFVWSGIMKKNYEKITDIKDLLTNSIYSKVRHPMYLGIAMMHIGFPLAFTRLWTLISAILWIGLMIFWRYWEEKDLEKSLGKDYLEYKNKTWF